LIGRDYYSIIKYKDLFFSRKVAPFGVEAAQTWVHICKHFEVIQEFDVKLFVELGMLAGGLASIILTRTEYVPDFRYVGVDNRNVLDPRVAMKISQANNARFIQGNVFDVAITDQIQTEISTCNGAAYIFCDNGDKPKELMTYHKFLRVGDLIAVHDYELDKTVNDDLLSSLPPSLTEIDPERFRHNAHLPVFQKVQ